MAADAVNAHCHSCDSPVTAQEVIGCYAQQMRYPLCSAYIMRAVRWYGGLGRPAPKPGNRAWRRANR